MENRRNITPEEVERTPEVKTTATTSAYNPKNYLNVRLEDGVNEKTLKIRVLTIGKDSNSPFKHIKMHNVKVPKEVAASGYKNYICLEKTEGEFSETMGHKCPFCELNRSAYKKFTEETNDVRKEYFKKISLENIPNEVGIIRCIERGHEEDGPKFWKFNIRQDKMDPEGQMRALYTTRKQESIDEAKEDNNGELPEGFVPRNIFDIDEGKDFLVTITRAIDKDGKPTDKTSVKISDYGSWKPLSKDEAQRDAWLDDEKKWSDVFTAKPYDYLSVILEGKTPWFDKVNNKWGDKDEILGNTTEKKTEANSKIDDAEKRIINNSNVNNNDDDDELPY